jgi:hypothetical protein
MAQPGDTYAFMFVLFVIVILLITGGLGALIGWILGYTLLSSGLTGSGIGVVLLIVWSLLN